MYFEVYLGESENMYVRIKSLYPSMLITKMRQM